MTALSPLQKVETSQESPLVLKKPVATAKIRKSWRLLTQKANKGIDFAHVRRINFLIFYSIRSKLNFYIPTPDKFLWPLRNVQLIHPIPIQETCQEFTLSSQSEDILFQKENGQFVFCSKKPEIFYLNGKQKLLTKGTILKEGTIVCMKNEGSNELNYLVTVGKNGNVFVMDDVKKRVYPNKVEKVKKESYTLAEKQCFPSSASRTYVAEFSQFFPDGLIFSSTMRICPTLQELQKVVNSKFDKDEQLIIDRKTDKILKALIKYLKFEFGKIEYTEEQKIFRLWLLVAAILKPADPKTINLFENYNFYLGEFLRYGYGTCRHFALVLKTLADTFKIQTSLKIKCQSNVGHAWLEARINQKLYKMDDSKFVQISESAV